MTVFGLLGQNGAGKTTLIKILLGMLAPTKLRIRGYSKGMKQRLGLAQALLHRPSVLFLDEPTDGVDPVGRKQTRELLLAERARGVTIFINSHLLGEIEQLCDRVAILRKGQLALVGTVAEVVGAKTTWLVSFDRPVRRAWLRQHPQVAATPQRGRRFSTCGNLPPASPPVQAETLPPPRAGPAASTRHSRRNRR